MGYIMLFQVLMQCKPFIAEEALVGFDVEVELHVSFEAVEAVEGLAAAEAIELRW